MSVQWCISGHHPADPTHIYIPRAAWGSAIHLSACRSRVGEYSCLMQDCGPRSTLRSFLAAAPSSLSTATAFISPIVTHGASVLHINSSQCMDFPCYLGEFTITNSPSTKHNLQIHLICSKVEMMSTPKQTCLQSNFLSINSTLNLNVDGFLVQVFLYFFFFFVDFYVTSVFSSLCAVHRLSFFKTEESLRTFFQYGDHVTMEWLGLCLSQHW